MGKAKQKNIMFALAALLLIGLAMLIRYANRYDFGFSGTRYLRSAIYIFLLTAWGFSIHARIVQTQVRRYLLAVSALMVLWMLLRSIKFTIGNPDAERWLWYLYYVPIMLIPLLAVFVSLSLGMAEDFCLPQRIKLLYVPTLLMIAFVLTNDFHQWVFSFPSGILTDRDYRYEAGYFLVMGWGLLCAAIAFTMMVIKCRIPNSKGFRWRPIIPLALSIAYSVAYMRGGHWVWVLAGDLTVTQCLIFAAIFESCIQCGLIQSNLGYDELLEATRLPVQITDEDFCTRHVSAAMQEPLPQSELRQMKLDAVRLDGDTILKRHRLRRGWVFWKEDISELNLLRNELELTRDELRDTGDVLAAENAQRARLLKLTEENRLYDMMEAQTARQIAMLRDRLAELQRTEELVRAGPLLGQVIIIGTYIKRRNNLIFVGVQRGSISVQELRLCLNESAENLELYGVDCKAVVKGDGQLTIEQATQVYDLFEAVVEEGLESLHSLLAYIEAGRRLEVNLCASGAEPLCGLKERFPGLEWEQDEDGLQYISQELEKSGG